MLMELGFSDFRLRLRGDEALLQVRKDQMAKARADLDRINRLLAGDFRSVALDSVARESREV